MTEIGDLLAFVKVVEKEGFTAAASALNCSTSSISKKITRLEHKVGAKLINRSTHGLHLTEAGSTYFERTQKIIADLEDARDSVREVTNKLSGTLKVYMTPGPGNRLVMPWILDFIRRYPLLQVRVSDRMDAVNILRSGFDVSIQTDAVTGIDCPPGVVAHELSRAGYLIYGSRAYFERHGRPAHPRDLVNHNCLISVAQRSPDRWWFMEGKKKFSVNVNGNLVADDWAVIYDAVLAGLGIARVFDLSPPRFVPHADLEVLFANNVVADRALWAQVPIAKPMPRKIRVFLDFLTKSLRSN
jgi:DNA-binding transcriptional LysR family regulator